MMKRRHDTWITASFLDAKQFRQATVKLIHLGYALLNLSMGPKYSAENFIFCGFATKITFGSGCNLGREAGLYFLSLRHEFGA